MAAVPTAERFSGLRQHPRTSVTLSRVAQGVSSFAFAAAGTGGFVTTVITLSVAAVICTGAAVYLGEARQILPTLRMRNVWVISLTGFVAMFFAAQAYHLASVATVSFLLLLVPLFAGLMAPLYGERLTRNGVIGMAISIVGALLFAQPNAAFSQEWLGLLCAVIGGLALAVLWHQSRDLAAHDDALWALSASQNYPPAVIGLVVVVLGGLTPSGTSMWWLLIAGIGYSGNVILRLFGLRRLTASAAALIAPVSALVSTLLGVLILHQVPDAITWVGAAIITVGVLVSTRPDRVENNIEEG